MSESARLSTETEDGAPEVLAEVQRAARGQLMLTRDGTGKIGRRGL